MRKAVKIRMWSVILVALAGLLVVLDITDGGPNLRPLTGGPVHGVVIDVKSNRPLTEATVVVKWIGHVSSDHGPSYPCYYVALAQTDNEGKFTVPAWQLKIRGGADEGLLRWVDTKSIQKPLEIAAYKRDYFIDRGPEPFAKDVNVLLKMEPSVGTVQARLAYLVADLHQQTLCGADNKKLIPVYQAAYEEGNAIATSDEELKLVDSLLTTLESAQYGNSVALDRKGQRRLLQTRTLPSERSK
ncbi:MAG: hypothetical protein ABI537_09485 [Casimicrobiaceae bacterium]